MILRGAAFGLFLVVVLLLQTVVAPAAAVADVPPDLVILSVLAVGMLSGSGLGIRYGFVAGLAVDVMAGPNAIIGVSVLLFLLAGYAAGLVRPFIAASQLPGQVVVAGIGVTTVIVVQEFFEFMLGQTAPAALPLLIDAVIAGLYAAVLAPIFCLLVARLERINSQRD